MPSRPLKPCKKCGKLSETGYCPEHTPAPWKKYTETERIVKGRPLTKAREYLFRRQPLCAACGVRASTIRDHIIPLSQGGEDTYANTQGICEKCHTEKTLTEALNGRKT